MSGRNLEGFEVDGGERVDYD